MGPDGALGARTKVRREVTGVPSPRRPRGPGRPAPLPLLPSTPFLSHLGPGSGVQEGKGVDTSSQEGLK